MIPNKHKCFHKQKKVCDYSNQIKSVYALARLFSSFIVENSRRCVPWMDSVSFGFRGKEITSGGHKGQTPAVTALRSVSCDRASYLPRAHPDQGTAPPWACIHTPIHLEALISYQAATLECLFACVWVCVFVCLARSH